MKRYLIIGLAIAIFYGMSWFSQAQSRNQEEGDRVFPSIVVQNGDCKGDRKDDC